MISSTFTTGLQGVQSGFDQLNRSADQIAKASVPPEKGGSSEIVTPLVEQITGKQQVQASAKVVQTANEALGSIIDIKV